MFLPCYPDGMSRLSIDVSPEQHYKIKALAALQGQSIKEFVLERVIPEEEGEELTVAVELENVLRSRIESAKWSSTSIQQINEDLLKRR